MPPIDPLQLLKALAPLLAPNGGIRSIDEVGRLSSLMKKFSKKLVSRCVYVNVLRTSKPEFLDGFLKNGGWETVHSWLHDTKTQQNHTFLMELLKLYRMLPMTIERLKENGSAKIVKSLTKNEREDIKQISTDIYNSWVKLVKGDSESVNKSSKDDKSIKKRKKKDEKDIKSDKEKEKSKDKKDVKKEETKKEVKNSTTSKENKAVAKAEELEDVQLPDYIRNPEPKDIVKPKERKSTVKLYQTKFRSTGLEEAVPLPRHSVKKSFDKVPPLIISKNSVKRLGSTLTKDLGPIPKKLKPPTLSFSKFEPESLSKDLIEKSPIANERREIKLIAPRPKPAAHTLTESAGFMDALFAPAAAPIRKKKKSSSSKCPNTPSSPTTPPAAPKLQFYKDTLEVADETTQNAENKKEEVQKISEIQDGENKEVENMEEEALEEETPISPRENDNENDDTSDTNSTVASNKRKRKSKKVSWAEEGSLKQIFYFEMDETERVNVNNVKNFGDLKTLERLKEREVVESSRRGMVGQGEERMSWFVHAIDDIGALVVMGCNSKERDIQKLREESVLQEIFFSKESLPDAPHETDPEFFEPEEPKIIPLEDENNPDAVVDYSMMEPPAPVTTLPPALTNLFQSLSKTANPIEDPNYNMYMSGADPSQMPSNFLPPGPPNMMGPNPAMMGPNPGMMGPAFNNMGGFPPRGPPMGPPFIEGMEYYGNQQGPDMSGGPMGRQPRGHRAGNNRGWGPPRGQMNNRGRGPGGGRGGRGRVPCHHFMAGGCKYEESCKFLHPGVNGPPL